MNGAAIYGSRPHVQSSLATVVGARVRLTNGADGATYAMVFGRAQAATVLIDGLPTGRVTLLGVDAELPRTGDAIDLPAGGCRPGRSLPFASSRPDGPSHQVGLTAGRMATAERWLRG